MTKAEIKWIERGIIKRLRERETKPQKRYEREKVKKETDNIKESKE